MSERRCWKRFAKWRGHSPAMELDGCLQTSVPSCLISPGLQAIAGKVAVSLLSPSAFTFAADLIGQYEGSGVGLHWTDMWSDPLPLGAILFMLAIDAKIYAGLAW